MELKRYSAAALLLLALTAVIALIGGPQGALTLTLAGWSFSLPLAAWMVLPAFGLFLASLAHMAYYSMSAYFKKASSKREFETFLDETARAVLGHPYTHAYTNHDLKKLAHILDAFDLKPKGRTALGHKKIDSAVDTRLKIEEGGWVEDKGDLVPVGSLAETNDRQRAMGDLHRTETLLKKATTANSDTLALFEAYAARASWEKIASIPLRPTRAVAMAALARVGETAHPLEVDAAAISRLAQEAALTSDDFKKLALLWLSRLSPEVLLGLFDRLAENFAAAEEARIILLLEYEMLVKAADALEKSDAPNLAPYRYFLKLRREGMTMHLKEFFGTLPA